MQSKKSHMKRKKVNDYPELQVGFPERNDVSNPELEYDADDVESESVVVKGGRKLDRSRDMQGARVSHA